VVLLNALVGLPKFMLVNNSLFPVLDSKLNLQVISFTLDERYLKFGLRLLLDLLLLSGGGLLDSLFSFLGKLEDVLG